MRTVRCRSESAGQRLLHAPAHLRLLEGVDGDGARVGAQVVEVAVLPARAQVVVAGVDGDAVQPRREVRAGHRRVGQLAERLDEDVLGDVAGVLGRLHDAQRQVVDARTVQLVELLEGVASPGAKSVDEERLLVGGRSRRAARPGRV